MTTNDVVGWLVWGLDKKGALCLGLFAASSRHHLKKGHPKGDRRRWWTIRFLKLLYNTRNLFSVLFCVVQLKLCVSY